MGKLNDQVAIVTGGSRGQGAMHVRKLLNEGAKVVFSDILVNEGEALAKELGENVKFVKHDVTKADEWKNVIQQAETTFGPISILVNNAGIVLNKKFKDFPEDEFRKILDINFMGQFHGMQKVFPSMKKAGKGSIINISSIDGLRGAAGNSAYDASKFAVRGLTKTVALEYAEYNIRVNSIHPGVIETPMIKAEDTEDIVESLLTTVPLNRVGRPEEISNLVVFLASDDSSYSTGSEFIADGGITASN
ncbi:glucose 1-dehydrogenase [Staphylococcus pseudoxylosus]|uniref:glucose 1-dehydrogenase n=1 Tax=Staphylococcus pseudoxylosus TaxID=2282419 RepID=UPI003905EE76